MIESFLGVGMAKNGCKQPGDGTLTLTLSEEWADGINWIFASWYRFTKGKNLSKFFQLGMVKNGCNQSGHGTCLYLENKQWNKLIFYTQVQIQES